MIPFSYSIAVVCANSLFWNLAYPMFFLSLFVLCYFNLFAVKFLCLIIAKMNPHPFATSAGDYIDFDCNCKAPVAAKKINSG